MQKTSPIFRTNYLNYHISISQAANRTWSYTIHSEDWQKLLVQGRGLETDTKAWESAKANVDSIVNSK